MKLQQALVLQTGEEPKKLTQLVPMGRGPAEKPEARRTSLGQARIMPCPALPEALDV
jgi:hypothetical protein